MDEYIVLLHGIFRTPRSMRGLEKYLSRKGYKVINIAYPSTRHRLEDLAQIIHHKIPHGKSKIHFIGYSMGGLLVRAYLTRYHPQNLGRVVMLGTPNQGSEVADFYKNFYPFKKFYGPAGQQLLTKYRAPHIFGKVDYELGIIAGNKSIAPFSSWLIGQPNDGKVSVASSKLDGMKEHMVLPVTHTFFLLNKKVRKLTYNFIKNGTFKIAKS